MDDWDKLIPFGPAILFFSVHIFVGRRGAGDKKDTAGRRRRTKRSGDLYFSVSGNTEHWFRCRVICVKGKRLFAFVDDICIVCTPERVGAVYESLEDALRTNVGINIHLEKPKLWNAEGRKPGVADALTAAAQKVKPEAVVWRGDLSW